MVRHTEAVCSTGLVVVKVLKPVHRGSVGDRCS